ncbi:MAG TPA: hypothetical protein VM282_07710 [Acidimicrobiales bacterium]|nr:hypothetical protein [Acidimicrobiales bacterium]
MMRAGGGHRSGERAHDATVSPPADDEQRGTGAAVDQDARRVALDYVAYNFDVVP